MGMTVTYKILIHEGVKGKFNLSSHETFVFSPAAKNTQIEIYVSIILPVVLCVCKTWSLVLREEYKVSVFEDRVLR
jgi:hypothetical protein